MKVLRQGHLYELNHLDGDGTSVINFVDRGHGHDSEGTTCQEVLKVLIDRVIFLDNELPWNGNKDILQHLRMALILFECRALARKVEKQELKPESLSVSQQDLHIDIKRLIKRFG